eukprot:364195-Chlamydomonas_euryale.AAC.14
MIRASRPRPAAGSMHCVLAERPAASRTEAKDGENRTRTFKSTQSQAAVRQGEDGLLVWAMALRAPLTAPCMWYALCWEWLHVSAQWQCVRTLRVCCIVIRRSIVLACVNGACLSCVHGICAGGGAQAQQRSRPAGLTCTCSAAFESGILAPPVGVRRYGTYKLVQKMPGGDKLTGFTRVLHRGHKDECMDEVGSARRPGA